MMRMTISRSRCAAIAMVGTLVVPTFALGQDSTVMSRTHVVRKGDTLWDLARHYMSDPFQWRSIHRLNTQVVEDPHWIYPGETLRLPGAAARDATAAPAAAAAPASDGADDASTERATIDLAAPRSDAAFGAPTVFRTVARDPYLSSRTARSRLDRPASPTGRSAQAQRSTVRPGEYYAAPYVEREGGPANAGRIVGTGDVPSIPLTEEHRPLQMYERVFIVPPPGMSTAPGTRLVAVRNGPVLPGLGQVVIPTGILRIERAESGQAAEALVLVRFEQLMIGDALVTIDFVPTDLPRPNPQAAGAPTSVVWVEGSPVLPTLQSYLVIEGGSGAGMRIGDQVTFYRERRTSRDGVVLPETDIAVAQVVRVTPYASTALVIAQDFGAIKEGTPGRVTAKMP